MVIPTNQQAYARSQGTSTIPTFIFEDRDPTTNDIKYPLYSAWVNTLTKGIWYLEAFNPTGGFQAVLVLQPVFLPDNRGPGHRRSNSTLEKSH